MDAPLRDDRRNVGAKGLGMVPARRPLEVQASVGFSQPYRNVEGKKVCPKPERADGQGKFLNMSSVPGATPVPDAQVLPDRRTPDHR